MWNVAFRPRGTTWTDVSVWAQRAEPGQRKIQGDENDQTYVMKSFVNCSPTYLKILGWSIKDKMGMGFNTHGEMRNAYTILVGTPNE
jgi:hypothetical protein